MVIDTYFPRAARRRMAQSACLAVLAALSACAAEGPPDGPGFERGQGRGGPDGERHGGPPPARASLFISPACEPFRSGPGDPYPSAAWFAQADANHDGRLTRAEVRTDAEAFFRRLDVNQDGVIDSFEVMEYEQRIVPEILGAYRVGPWEGGGDEGRGRGAPPGGDGPGPPGGGGRHGGGGPPGGGGGGPGGGVLEGAEPYEFTQEPEPLMAADQQLNGRITLAAFLHTVDRRFESLDRTHTGSIALVDLPKTPSQPAEPPKGGRGKRPSGAEQGPPRDR